MTDDSPRPKRPFALQRAVENQVAAAMGGKLHSSYRFATRAAVIATLREIDKASPLPAVHEVCLRELALLVDDATLVKQSLCDHVRATGGNDYQSCTECGLTWDYRSSTADRALMNLISMQLGPKIPKDEALIVLSVDDAVRLTTLLENAEAEVDASAETPDAVVMPDDPSKLMSSYNWSRGLRARLKTFVEAL